MGFDTSFHPVDYALIHDRILPYLLGERDDIDDLVGLAVRISQVRFRANAWGLGAREADPPESFDPFLHIWGRPFLVTGTTAAEIGSAIDAWLSTHLERADDLARAQLEALEPGFSKRVAPSKSGSLPPPDALYQNLRHRLDVLRACIAAVRAGDAEIRIGEDVFEPRTLVGRELMDVVLEFSAHFRPGWMSRGVTWPTALLEGPARELFISNQALIMPAREALPGMAWAVAETITENYMVGGCLSPKDIPAVRKALADEATEPTIDLQKLDEALTDAALRDLPFAEATEIYSGVGGILN